MEMKMNKHIGSLVAVLAGVAFFLPTHTLAAAFGVSPPWIENENLKPGTSFVYVINLSSNELSDDMTVNAKVTGSPEVVKWLSIPDSGNLVMAKGQVQVPMNVDLNVPSNAPLGKYTGTISLSLSPKTPGGQSIAVLLGANISVKLDVINHDVTDYWVQSISANPVKEGQPIRLNVRVKNDGNTDITSVPVNVEVLDGNTQKLVAEGVADKLMAPVLPHTLDEVQMDVPVPHIEAGNYWVKASVMKNKKATYENKLFVAIEPLGLNNVVKTQVLVAEQGTILPAASENPAVSVPVMGRNVDVRTSVTVRAPMTNTLILIVIGLLLVIAGIAGRMYYMMKKKEHHHGHNHR
jgi:hypothetical protein